MPRFDGNGPFRGLGPRSGRGLGPCKRRTLKKSSSEKELLQEEAKILEEELKEIKSRLSEIEK